VTVGSSPRILGRPAPRRVVDTLLGRFGPLFARAPRASLLLLGIPLAYLIVLYAVPVLLLLKDSFFAFDVATQRQGGFTLGHYIRYLTEPAYLRVIWSTLRIGLTVTLVTLVLGYPVAYALARAPQRVQQIMLAIIVSPLLVSIVIRTFAWTILLRTEGVVNSLLLSIGVIDRAIPILYTEAAVIIALVHVHLPFMIIPIASVLQKIDPSLEAAATSLGANSPRRLTEIVLPLSVPGIAAGSMLVLTTTVSAYVTPAMIGGERVLVMPTLIAQQILDIGNWSFGSAIATILIVVVMAAVVLYSRYIASRTRYLQR